MVSLTSRPKASSGQQYPCPAFLYWPRSSFGKQVSGPDRGQSPVEWGDFPYVHSSVRPSVRPSVHPFPPLRPETWLVVWAWGLADWGTTKMSNFLCLLAKSPISYLTIPAESRPKMSNKMSNFLKRDTIFSFLDIFFLGRSLSILWFLNYWTSDGWLWILIYTMYEIKLSHSLLRMIDINLSI
jgi:hypothetical protein